MVEIIACNTDEEGQNRFSFSNVKTAARNDGRDFLYRASQPNYTDNDAPHSIGLLGMTWLRHSRFGAVISANHHNLSTASKNRLRDAGIHFMHCRVEDYQPPTAPQLLNAAALIERNRLDGKPVLVYCGAGCGRTGTFIAAWALKYHPDVFGETADSIREGAAEYAFDDALGESFGVETVPQARAIYRALLDYAPPAILPAPPPPGAVVPTLVAGGNPGAAYAQFNVDDGPEPAPPTG